MWNPSRVSGSTADVSLQLGVDAPTGPLVAVAIDLCERLDLDVDRATEVAAALIEVVAETARTSPLSARLRLAADHLRIELSAEPPITLGDRLRARLESAFTRVEADAGSPLVAVVDGPT